MIRCHCQGQGDTQHNPRF